MSATEWHWWNYAGFFGGLFFMALAAYGMYVHWDSRPSFLRRKSPKGTAYSVDAIPASFHFLTSEATVSVRPPPWSKPILRIRSAWGRRRGSRPANKRLQNVPDLKRCLDELIKYSGFPVTEKVTSEQIEASNALLRHLRRAAAILDEQGEPHPKIEKGLTVINHTPNALSGNGPSTRRSSRRARRRPRRRAASRAAVHPSRRWPGPGRRTRSI